jgi:hypothetical protein
MFGLSRIQLGIIAALVVALGLTGWLLLRKAERLGLERAARAGLEQAVADQVRQTRAVQAEVVRRDVLLADVEAERDGLAQRKARIVTRVQEVLVNDPDAALCGSAVLPESVRQLVREYAAGGDDAGGVSAPASEPDRPGT